MDAYGDGDKKSNTMQNTSTFKFKKYTGHLDNNNLNLKKKTCEFCFG